MECTRCKSTRIEEGVAVAAGLSTENVKIGLKYSKGPFIGVAPLYCDVCKDCGEVIRIYIKDEFDRPWLKR
jgi:hypothetical protein